MIIAVDFDGTIVEHEYPAIGREIPFATETLKMLMKQNHKLIMWSVREGKLLDDAVNGARIVVLSFMLSTRTIQKRRLTTTTTSRAS